MSDLYPEPVEGWLKLVLLSLACYRLAQLFVYDEGPFGVFQQLRLSIGGYDYNEQGQARTSLGRLITCPYCLGMWIALFMAVSAYGWPEFIIYWLAIAGLQAFLQGLVTR
jgi:hypothetical protein